MKKDTLLLLGRLLLFTLALVIVDNVAYIQGKKDVAYTTGKWCGENNIDISVLPYEDWNSPEFGEWSRGYVEKNNAYTR